MMILLEYGFVFLMLVLSALSAATFVIFVLDSLIYGHDLPTSRRAAKALVVAVKQYKPDAKNFYDLGCAHGDLCLRLKKDLPDVAIWGIDKSPVRIFFAKLKARILRRKANFKKQDIFQTDLSNADVVYTYLWYDRMSPLEEKLQKELKPGALVITNTSRFPNLEPLQKISVSSKVFPKMPDHEILFVYVKA